MKLMGADFLKAVIDGLDKITDILNLGRLIFYTAAGFCASLPVAVGLRLLACEHPQKYWLQFVTDLRACTEHWELWVAALIFGFVIANLANSVVMDRFARPPRPPAGSEKEKEEKDSYPYSYARLCCGGVCPTPGATSAKDTKDYAAWLISEYYRYVEIVVFIPYGILLSLPVYSLYSLVWVLTARPSKAFVLHSGHVAFAVWTLGSLLAWKVAWSDFWVPRVAEPLYKGWVIARRSAIAGVQDFMGDPKDKGSSQDQKSNDKAAPAKKQ
jgi:hypothetical protein